METSIIATSEDRRQEVLNLYEVLDSAIGEEFENLVRLAAFSSEKPFAQLNFITESHQLTKSSFGLKPEMISRDKCFCTHTIEQEGTFLMSEDTLRDPRFNKLPMVKKDPGIRFYAGFNIKTKEGFNVGTLCVMGTEPARLDDRQLEMLESLAREAEVRLELRRKKLQLEKTKTFLENSADLIMIVDPETMTIEEINEGLEHFGKFEAEYMTGKRLEALRPENSFIENFQTWVQNHEQSRFSTTAIFEIGDKKVWLRVNAVEKEGKIYFSARDVTLQKQTERAMWESLNEKEVLLQEVHHRVKNNLAVISSFLQLEEFKTESEEARRLLADNHMRVKSMALIHEDLYKTSSFVSLKFSSYLKKLLRSIESNLEAQKRGIKIETDIDPVILNINQAVPCALIINELVNNAFKYAFPDSKTGTIWVSVKEEDNALVLKIADDGIGLPDDFKLEKSPTLGITLVYTLSKQIKSKVEVSTSPKTEFRIRFDVQEVSGSSGNVLKL